MQVSFTFLRILSLALVTAHLSGAGADSSGTLHNITVDDTDGSPDGLYKVIYSPPDAWKAGSAKGCDGCLVSDIDTSKLQNGTWHEAAYDATHPQQITATVLFNGTGVWIYGLLPHTNLSATNDVYFQYAIDSPLTSGFVNAIAEHGNLVNSTAAVDYDVFLFGVSALNESRPHNVTLLVGSGGNPRSTQGSDSPVLSSIFLLDYVVIMQNITNNSTANGTGNGGQGTSSARALASNIPSTVAMLALSLVLSFAISFPVITSVSGA